MPGGAENPLWPTELWVTQKELSAPKVPFPPPVQLLGRVLFQQSFVTCLGKLLASLSASSSCHAGQRKISPFLGFCMG